MVKTKGSPAGKGSRRRATGPKQRQVSEKAMSKWKPLSSNVRSMALMLLEDATSRFQDSGQGELNETLMTIKESFERALSALKAPDKMVIAERDLNTHASWLHEEKDRLRRLEISLTEALKLETRKAEDLETKVEQLRMTQNTEESDIEVHPLLQNVLEGT